MDTMRQLLFFYEAGTKQVYRLREVDASTTQRKANDDFTLRDIEKKITLIKKFYSWMK